MSFIHNIVTFTIKQLYFAGIIIWRYYRDHTCVFHALTFVRVPRKVFENEADKPSAKTSSERRGKC